MVFRFKDISIFNGSRNYTLRWEMEQRHHEQLEALETKRQQIEEMEDKHRQAELKRVAEQDAERKGTRGET